MKKFALALMCALSVLLIVSCSKKKDEPTPEEPKLPTIEFVNAGGHCVYQDTEIISGDTVSFQVRAIATDANDLLTSLNLKLTYNNDSRDTTITLDNLTTYTYVAEPEAMELPEGLFTIEATAATKSGKTATAKVNITIHEATLEVNDFEWVRAGDHCTGLEQFGLEWELNAKEVKAKIVPVEGAILKTLEDVEFGAITTEMQKMVAFEQATQVDKFHEVSCEANHDDYNFVIMTQYNENIYLINITKGTVEKQPDNSYIFTISGQWK